MTNQNIVPTDSKQRVAYDLALHISSYEKEATKDRKYWLSLYHQCYKATMGESLESILK